DGAFTITGTTEPGARVVSSTGQSAVGGADGRFTLQGVISGSGEDVLITATDAAGNATTEGMTMVRAGGGGGDFGGGGGGGGGAAPRDPAAEDGKAPSAGWTNPFTDVNKSDWYYGDVEFVLANGLFVGTSATSFSPRLPMTRGMIVTVLGRLAKIDTGQYAGDSFDDVAADKYYAAFVRWAKESGIVSGVGGNLFAPDSDITRQDMAVILCRYARFMGIELPKKEEKRAFADEARIAGYASEAVYAMREAGIITGKPGNLADPQGKATRAEVAAMFHRFVEATK
ncbi:MAG: S-layer homology domain-containing protein, partial [Clostridiales Family XIII bacterium]|nr:S-layer homology domain-containing protein [Clostridiales Family XIII bacterium]